ncbi:MAG: hypothetical protein LWW83_00370 [Azonexaceae bacterium]|nr:hypothetical protein [Azonexaceae bacterium]
MEQQRAPEEEDREMIDINIKQFLEAARFYLLGLVPAQQPALAAIPVRRNDRR